MVEVYKRARSPYWYYDLADPTAPSGRRRVSTRRASKSEAVAVARMAEREVLDREQLGALEEITVEEALFRYARSVVRKSAYRLAVLQSSTLLGYRAYKGDKLEDRIPHPNGRHKLQSSLMLHRLTTAMIANLREHRAEEGLSDASINREVAALRAAHNLAKHRGVRVPKQIDWGMTRERGKLRWLTKEEVARLLVELDPHRTTFGTKKHMRGVQMRHSARVRRAMQDAYDLTIFLLDTGCRVGEASTIPWVLPLIRWSGAGSTYTGARLTTRKCSP
jgi:integrase